jgi:hypothetical protein
MRRRRRTTSPVKSQTAHPEHHHLMKRKSKLCLWALADTLGGSLRRSLVVSTVALFGPCMWFGSACTIAELRSPAQSFLLPLAPGLWLPQDFLSEKESHSRQSPLLLRSLQVTPHTMGNYESLGLCTCVFCSSDEHPVSLPGKKRSLQNPSLSHYLKN